MSINIQIQTRIEAEICRLDPQSPSSKTIFMGLFNDVTMLFTYLEHYWVLTFD